MEVKLTKEEIERLLSGYFKRKEGMDSVIIKPIKTYDYYDHEYCYVTAVITKRIVLFGKEREATETIGEEEIKNILREQLETAGYEVNRITLDCGFNTEVIGYYQGEEIQTIPYFNGVVAQIRSKDKVKKIGEK